MYNYFDHFTFSMQGLTLYAPCMLFCATKLVVFSSQDFCLYCVVGSTPIGLYPTQLNNY